MGALIRIAKNVQIFIFYSKIKDILNKILKHAKSYTHYYTNRQETFFVYINKSNYQILLKYNEKFQNRSQNILNLIQRKF